ncbi:MAG: hypothetical protein K6B17_07595 [Treponema sp.]|nr:hypothetical protein [Treponema sp.]
MKTTKMFAKIMGVILAGMMVMALAGCSGKADKVEGTYIHDDYSLVLNADGTGFMYQKTGDGFEWRDETGKWKEGKKLPENFINVKWTQDKKAKKVAVNMLGFDTMDFEYQDATVSLTCKYKVFKDAAFMKQ